MKKETGFAIFLGIMLGLTVAIIMVFKAKQEETAKAKPITAALQSTPTPFLSSARIQGLEISSPTDATIVKTKSIKITGKASKEALIVIQSPVKELVFKNEKIDFNEDFPLAAGENVIRISVYPKDTQLRIQEKELRVYYLVEQ